MKLISSVKKYDCGLFFVTEDHAVDPSGFEIRRSIVQHKGSAVMMAVDDRKRVLLVRQYRLPAEGYLWELPAGRLDEGEKPLQAAKRELIEETGYRAKHWKRAVCFYASPGFLDETMAIYLARELTLGEATPEEDEAIECKLIPLSRVIDMIFKSTIRDGKTITGVLWLAEAIGRGDLD